MTNITGSLRTLMVLVAMSALAGLTACTTPPPAQQEVTAPAAVGQPATPASQPRPCEDPVIRSQFPDLCRGYVPMPELVSVAPGIFCPKPVASQSMKDWVQVASDPSKKGWGAIADLGLPAAVQTVALRDWPHASRRKEGMIENGIRLCTMAYGENSVFSNVRARWHDRSKLHVQYITVDDGEWIWIILLPPKPERPEMVPVERRGCNNPAYVVVRRGNVRSVIKS